MGPTFPHNLVGRIDVALITPQQGHVLYLTLCLHPLENLIQ